jgi:hypothetical protein
MPSNKYSLGTSEETFEIPLPSGNTCLARQMGPEQLISSGLVDQLDLLTGMVSDLHVERVLKGKPGKAVAKAQEKKAQQEVLNSLLKDKVRWHALVDTLNKVVVECVVEPRVKPVPRDGEEREGDSLYVDKVDLADKIAVFTACLGGSLEKVKAMMPFRGGSKAAVDDVEAGEPVQ